MRGQPKVIYPVDAILNGVACMLSGRSGRTLYTENWN